MNTREISRRLLRIILTVLVLLLCLTACAGRGKGSAGSEGAEAEAAAETGQVTEGLPASSAEQEAEQEAQQETLPAEASSQEDSAQAETAAAEETEPKPTVVRHKQEGKHSAEFSGDDVIVRAGRKGSCRLKYRGAFNSIRINVTNNTDYDMAVRDCTIWGIEVASQEPDPELTLYGIQMGATRQEIADVYGEPFSKTFDDENHMSNMVYQFGEDIHSNQIVMIIFKDKKAVAASYDDFDLVVD